MLERTASYTNRSGVRDNNLFSSLSSSFKPDKYVDNLQEERRSLAICVVAPPFTGSDDACRFAANLALVVRMAEHRVTCLVQSDGADKERNLACIQLLQEHNVELAYLPTFEPGRIIGAPAQIRAYETFDWLKHHKFDLVHFPDQLGLGYYAILAKHQGLCFEDTLFCVSVQAPSVWIRHGDSRLPDRPDDLTIDFMERESVALSDFVISPSAAMLNWLGRNGWHLPTSTFVQQNPLAPAWLPVTKPESSTDDSTAKTRRLGKIDEIVFIESLEKRKGLELFCDAIDQVSQVLRSPVMVTFLGRDVEFEGKTGAGYIRDRAKRWTLPWQIIDNYNDADSMAYLSTGNRIAVIPNLQVGSPYAVLSCLTAEVPFVCSAIDGFMELIAPEDREGATFAPDAHALSAKLLHALASGVNIVRPTLDQTKIRQDWQAWHSTALQSRPRTAANHLSSTSDSVPPLVTVCIPHFNRPDFLRQAIHSIVAQDYPKIEVIVVDDGSTDTSAIAALAEIEIELSARGWSLLRQPHSSAGAARNLAAKHARGEYLLFMDDDNYAKPHELSTFVKVALNTGADILTCFLDHFSRKNAPALHEQPDATSVFLGAAPAAGVFDNVFGDTNALVRRQMLLELGGHVEDNLHRLEDWHFYVHAIMNGAKLEVVPESLFWYRQTEVNRTKTMSAFHGCLSVLGAYADTVPVQLRPLINLVRGMYLRDRELANNETRKNLSLRQSLWRLTQAYDELRAEHQKFCAEVDQKLSIRRNTITQLESTVAELREELEKHGTILDKKRADVQRLDQSSNELKATLEQRDVAFREMEKRVRDLQHELLMSKSQLDSVRSSTSWKVTRPLRGLRGALDPKGK